MKFNINGFELALWVNKYSMSDKSPTHTGTLKLDGKKVCDVVGWYNEDPENRRPNISVKPKRSGASVAERPDDLQGENIIDHPTNRTTDYDSRLDQAEQDLEQRLKRLEHLESILNDESDAEVA